MARAQVVGVPTEFLDDIEAVSYATGVPKSWLAALCEMTDWNPSFELRNVPSNTVRRFGIAGIWARLEEIIIRSSDVGYVGTGFGNKCEWAYAGWFSGGFEGTMDTVYCPGPCKKNLELYRPVRANLTLAGQILKEARQIVQTMCGEENALIFLRYMWGCRWIPWNALLDEPRCTYPPGTPNLFINEAVKIIAAQKIFAEYWNEPGFGVPPPTITLTANTFITSPGQVVTFMAAIAGGNPPYALEWDFGDGGIFTPDPSPIINPSVGHAYESIGVYQVTVKVTDRVGQSAFSPPIGITIEEGAPPPPSGGAGGLALLGLLGLAGVIGLAAAKKKKKPGAK